MASALPGASVPAAPPRPGVALGRLALMLLLILGLPALYRPAPPPPVFKRTNTGQLVPLGEAARSTKFSAQTDPRGTPFNAKPLEKLREHQPEYVILGDSMVRWTVDHKILRDLLGGARVDLLWQPASTTARWYLFLKNYLIPSGAKPKVTFILYRDRYFSFPAYKIDGPYWEEILACMPGGEDPVVNQLVGDYRSSWQHQLGDWLSAEVYPVQDRSQKFIGRVHEFGRRAVTRDHRALETQLNAEFGFETLRPGLNLEAAGQDRLAAVPFSPDPTQSFLPHLVDLARTHDLPLHFVRVKRRPNQGDARVDPPELTQYVADLAAWLKTQGIGHTDFTADPAFTLDKYGEGDHLAPAVLPWSTAHFYRTMVQQGVLPAQP